jgi:hypothetical protein
MFLNVAAKQAAEKVFYSVILSEAKNLSSIELQDNKEKEILRFAQNDRILSFSAACEAATHSYTFMRGA